MHIAAGLRSSRGGANAGEQPVVHCHSAAPGRLLMARPAPSPGDGVGSSVTAALAARLAARLAAAAAPPPARVVGAVEEGHRAVEGAVVVGAIVGVVAAR